MAADENRICTCGWKRFRTSRSSTTEAVQRWVFYDEHTQGGVGSQFSGTLMGGGTSGSWGLFDAVKRTCIDTTTCENCARVRSSVAVASGVIFGGYASGGEYIVVASDVGNTGCFALKFTGPTTIDVGVKKREGIPLSIPMGTPLQGPEVAVPAGGVAATTLLYAPLPLVTLSGTYTVTLENRCCP